MFTGIVAAVGRIENVSPAPGGVRLRIAGNGLAMDDVALGDSIAVSGVCLTVVAFDKLWFEAEVSQASLGTVAGFVLRRAPRSTSKKHCVWPTGWAGT